MNTHYFDRYSQHIERVVYILIWFTGILLGVVAAVNCNRVSAAIIYGAFLKSPSVVGIIALGFARILIFYFALRYGKPVIMCALLFADAFCLGFCGIAIYITVGEPAWLLWPLVLITRIWSYVPIWWMLLTNSHRRKHIFLVAGFNCLLAIFDLVFVAPFLLRLANYL